MAKEIGSKVIAGVRWNVISECVRPQQGTSFPILSFHVPNIKHCPFSGDTSIIKRHASEKYQRECLDIVKTRARAIKDSQVKKKNKSSILADRVGL